MPGPRHRRGIPSNMHDDYDPEFDARRYSSTSYSSKSNNGRQYSAGHYDDQEGSSSKKRKKSKHKLKRKRDKEKDRAEKQHMKAEKKSSKPVKSLVSYDDISSDSDVGSLHSPISSRVPSDKEVENRGSSPATAIKSYMFERSHSNSPVAGRDRDSSPSGSGSVSTRRSKKRGHSPSEVSPTPRAYIDPPKAYANPPKAYADPPKAYADPPKSYRDDFRDQNDSPRKKYRSSPWSPSRSRKGGDSPYSR